MAKGTEVNRRLEAILELLSSEGPLSKQQLLEKLRERHDAQIFQRPDGAWSEGKRRDAAQEVMLRRALKDLHDRGLIHRDEVAEKAFRTKGDSRTQFWRAKEPLEPELDEIAALIALDTIIDSLQWVIPEEIRSDLENARRKAQARVGKMPIHSPEKRWLMALRVQAPYSDFERPIYDDDVRRNVEKAIKENKQVLIKYHQWHGVTFEGVVSITDWIVRLPDEVSIVLWEHAEVRGNTEVEMPLRAFEIPLNWVESVTLRDEGAHVPSTTEKKELVYSPLHGVRSHDSLRDGKPNGWGDRFRDTYEIRVSPRQMQRWKGLWIEGRLEVLGTDDDGWMVCRFHDAGRRGFQRYLFNLRDEVEVLSPYAVRIDFRKSADRMSAMYANEQELPRDVALDLEDRYIRDVYAEPGRFDLDQLDTLERQELAESEMWQQEPDLVELICQALNLHDPMWHCMDDVPASKTAYLEAAERIARRMPDLGSSEELETLLRSEFPSADGTGNFEGFDMQAYWRGMAHQIWSGAVRWRWDKRHPSMTV